MDTLYICPEWNIAESSNDFIRKSSVYGLVGKPRHALTSYTNTYSVHWNAECVAYLR
jgi:hypothetical protein